MKLIKKYLSQKRTKEYREYYYKNLFPPLDIKEIVDRIKKCEIIYHTKNLITFRNTINFFDNSKKVISSLGEPSYKKHNFTKDYTIFFYKNKIEKLKIKCQIHFINDCFIYAAQVFPNLTDKQIEELISIIKEKYIIHDHNKDIQIPFSIRDENENTLFIEKYFCLTINYLTGNSEILSTVEEIIPYEQSQIKSFKYLHKFI
ncbi:MAG: hypothetical protein N3A01_05055 [Bacteroidales bacterium]|nr:hypothetical protein [Bacteroidales bacterium]